MKRLFFALWPNDVTRQRIIQFDRRLTDQRLKKVRSDNLHVTLVFLGNVEQQQELAMVNAVDDIAAPVIDMQFDTLTYWRQKRGILSLTSSYQPSPLCALVELLQDIAQEQGVTIEKRPYISHITLARNLKQKPDIEFEPIRWYSDEFALVHSVSTDHGVDYQVIKRWSLSSSQMP